MNAKFVGSLIRVASIAAVPLAALAISAPAGAQGGGQRELFEWRGNVDQEVRVEMQNGRTSVIPMGPREMTGYDNARAMGGVPSTNGYVTVQMREGRGSADVVQQPTAQNGYTTVVRIRDGQSGAGSYDVAAFWQPAGNYGYGNSGAYGQSGQYGTYGQYGDNGQYGNYGQYGTYPGQVIVEQRPVYGPVYGDRNVDRGSIGGKTLPSEQRVNTYPGSYPSRSQSPGQVYGNGRYQNGNAQAGKTLPGTVQSRQSEKVQPAPAPIQSGQSGKALPGTPNRTNQQDSGWHRGH